MTMTHIAETAAEQIGEGTAPRIPVGDPLYFEALQFVWDEAATLDADDLKGWLDLLTPDIRYEIPVRATRERGDVAEHHDKMAHFVEDLAGIQLRMERVLSSNPWGENPPTRTRRFVTNVRAWRTDVADEIAVQSSVLVVQNRLDDPTLSLLPAERHDVLRRVGEELKLARRRILLDQTTLAVHNFAFFL